jgi:hypothetical protein
VTYRVCKPRSGRSSTCSRETGWRLPHLLRDRRTRGVARDFASTIDPQSESTLSVSLRGKKGFSS